MLHAASKLPRAPRARAFLAVLAVRDYGFSGAVLEWLQLAGCAGRRRDRKQSRLAPIYIQSRVNEQDSDCCEWCVEWFQPHRRSGSVSVGVCCESRAVGDAD